MCAPEHAGRGAKGRCPRRASAVGGRSRIRPSRAAKRAPAGSALPGQPARPRWCLRSSLLRAVRSRAAHSVRPLRRRARSWTSERRRWATPLHSTLRRLRPCRTTRPTSSPGSTSSQARWAPGARAQRKRARQKEAVREIRERGASPAVPAPVAPLLRPHLGGSACTACWCTH